VDAAPLTITVLLAADPKETRAGTNLPLPVRQEMERALKEADEFVLARAEDKLRARGVPVSTKRVEGGPPAVIAQEAQSGGYDLIVMGSRGLGLQNEEADLLGSVTERVLRRVSCPVLVVKQKQP
jgi:nucleotide-binding universal stress UspA family protein